MSARCLSCKKPLEVKKNGPYSGDFCSEYCFATHPRSTRHSNTPLWRAQRPKNSRREIDKILKRNHGILKAFKAWSHPGQTCSDIGGLQWLKSKGYDFDVHTHLGLHPDGATEIWCYDQGLRIFPGGGAHPI